MIPNYSCRTRWFVSGSPVSTVYPYGYQLSDVGPDTTRAEVK